MTTSRSTSAHIVRPDARHHARGCAAVAFARAGGLLAALALLTLAAQPASAQRPRGNQFGAPSIGRPTTSPYLNLLRRGGDSGNMALDYHRLVRPEQQLRRSAAAQEQQIGQLQRDVDRALQPDGTTSRAAPSGHQTTFMNLGRYYPTRGR